MPRVGGERYPQYNYGMPMQQPNIHYVHSSFERPPPMPCKLACCVTPGSVFNQHQTQYPQNKQRISAGKMNRSSSETKTLKKHPEAFYINTITNNYYQV
jgi:hypothetical protein